MEDNKKYNKRRKSRTEFRESYSDNKKYFISTDKRSKWSGLVKYTLIAVFIIIVIVMGFVITDALLNISEEPYKPEKVSAISDENRIDDKYFNDQVTIPADSVDEGKENDSLE